MGGELFLCCMFAAQNEDECCCLLGSGLILAFGAGILAAVGYGGYFFAKEANELFSKAMIGKAWEAVGKSFGIFAIVPILITITCLISFYCCHDNKETIKKDPIV
ncbi:MAG: hypothetical protein LBJ93_00800 [Clostridiales bacterium]|jgi:hypothetical protein|nr:hypothetical protein [Clostridiales bacterium]